MATNILYVRVVTNHDSNTFFIIQFDPYIILILAENCVGLESDS